MHDTAAKLEVVREICEDDVERRPHCKHGPALLFRKVVQGNLEEFYACSACRNPKECPVYQTKNKTNITPYTNDLIPYEEFKSAPHDRQRYCKSCQGFYLISPKAKSKHSNHETVQVPTDFLPSQFLAPISNEKTQAQYFFSTTTLDFFSNLFKRLDITHVICLGAPALHDHLISLGFKSFLLDIDKRFYSIYPPETFALYNMFNDYFFSGEESVNHFMKFLNNEKVLVFTDPPFGCRTELLADTLEKIKLRYQLMVKHRVLPIIWVFPYFMEMYIRNVMPELAMSDYKVCYENHAGYHENSKARKDLGSPVRIFTNIFPRFLKLPEGYRFCKPCDRYVAANNRHCNLCGCCPSKNGSQYKHCKKCHICVKPNYQHCDKCKKCAQRSHDCNEYLKHIRCYICLNKGHGELDCEKLPRSKRKGNCLKCGRNGHTHMNCDTSDPSFAID